MGQDNKSSPYSNTTSCLLVFSGKGAEKGKREEGKTVAKAVNSISKENSKSDE